MVYFTQAYAAHIGVTHSLEHVNCQDAAFACEIKTPVGVIQLGIVLDGCSSTPAPELGVQSAIKYIPKMVETIFNHPGNVSMISEKPWLLINKLYFMIQQRISELAILLGPETEAEFDQIIFDHFMFTVCGYVITPWHVLYFRAGDGVFVVNNDLYNATTRSSASYIGHTLVSLQNPAKVHLEKEGFYIKAFKAGSVYRVLVGTDGFAYGRAKQFVHERVWFCDNNAELLVCLLALFKSNATSDDMAIAKASLTGGGHDVSYAD